MAPVSVAMSTIASGARLAREHQTVGYELDDVEPGDTAQIFLSIQMIEEWQTAPIEARVVFTAAFADLSCPGGDTATATITITRGEISETETPEPSETAEPDTTPTVDATQTGIPSETETAVTETPETTGTPSPDVTPEETATPESTATEPVPTTAVPSETPPPEESETSIPITETTLPKTAEPSETFEPETETPTPAPVQDRNAGRHRDVRTAADAHTGAHSDNICHAEHSADKYGVGVRGDAAADRREHRARTGSEAPQRSGPAGYGRRRALRRTLGWRRTDRPVRRRRSASSASRSASGGGRPSGFV